MRKHDSLFEPEPEQDPEEVGSGDIDYTLEEIDNHIRTYLGQELEEVEGISLEELTELHNFFTEIDPEGTKTARQEDIEELWSKFLKDPYLVQDATLWALDRKRQVNRSFLERISIPEMKQYSQAISAPHQIRPHLVETVVPNLVSLGLSERECYELALAPKSPIAGRATRFLGWLVGQNYMHNFPETLKEELKYRKLTLRDIAGLATMEVMDQVVQHERGKVRYRLDIPTEQYAYEHIDKGLRSTLALCESFLLGGPKSR